MEEIESTTKKRGRRKKVEQHEQSNIDISKDIVPMSEDIGSEVSLHNTDDCSLEIALAEDTITETANPNAITPASTISVGQRCTLPFTRLYPSSISKTSICVCSGDIEILSSDVYDGRVNVFDRGKNLNGWINISEIKQ